MPTWLADYLFGGSLAIAAICILAYHYIGYVNGRYDHKDQ